MFFWCTYCLVSSNLFHFCMMGNLFNLLFRFVGFLFLFLIFLLLLFFLLFPFFKLLSNFSCLLSFLFCFLLFLGLSIFFFFAHREMFFKCISIQFLGILVSIFDTSEYYIISWWFNTMFMSWRSNKARIVRWFNFLSFLDWLWISVFLCFTSNSSVILLFNLLKSIFSRF